MDRIEVHQEDVDRLENEIGLAEQNGWDAFFFKFIEDKRMFEIELYRAKGLLQNLQIQYAVSPIKVNIDIRQFIHATQTEESERRLSTGD
jgi:hypothetical protein